MKQNWKRALALFTTLCMLMALLPAALAAPGGITYVLDEDGIDSGAVYAIYHSGSSRILYHASNTTTSDQVTGTVTGDSLTLANYAASRQLWTITAVEDGYTVQSQEADGRYLNLNGVTNSGSKVPVTDTAQTLTITAVEGGYTISRTVDDQTLYLAHDNGSAQHYVSATPCTFQLYKLTEEESVEPEPTIPWPSPATPS